jgi:3-phenylpropionate/trans-cinnamate dioxygenase ferredoxin subunit
MRIAFTQSIEGWGLWSGRSQRQSSGVNMFNYTKVDDSKVEYIDIAPISDLPNGERLFLEIEGKSLVIFNIADQFFAIGDICSHDDGPVGEGDLEGYNIVCPRHGGEFDVRTGQAVQMPAVVDIPAYPIRVVDGMIQVGIPKD